MLSSCRGQIPNTKVNHTTTKAYWYNTIFTSAAKVVGKYNDNGIQPNGKHTQKRICALKTHTEGNLFVENLN